MGFCIKQSDTYVWPVSVKLPTNGGRYDTQTFDVEFRRVSQARIEELLEQGRSAEINDRAVCGELVAGWQGITDGTGEVPFSDAAFRQLLDIPGIQAAIIAAWFESLSGEKRKN